MNIIPPPKRDDPPAPNPPVEGPRGKTGETGETGDTGETGKAGRGIASVSINQEGVLLIVLDDGTILTAGVVRGPDGMPDLLERFSEVDKVLEFLKNGFRYESVDVDGNLKFQQVKPGKTLRIIQTPVKVIGAE